MNTPAPSTINAVLAAYLPLLELRLLADPAWKEDRPCAQSFPGAVLMVDISGFTELTQQFQSRGKTGAEELSGILRSHFGELTEIILKHGGDVISFAGDAAIAVWPAADTTGLFTATEHCVAAAEAVKRAIAIRAPVQGVTLRQRSAIAAGNLLAMKVGGESRRWQFLLAGDPLQQAGAALRDVAVGAIAISSSAMEFTREAVETRKSPAEPTPLNTARATLETRETVAATCLPPGVSLEDYVPAFIAERVTAGLGNWLAEFRNITALFIGFPDFDVKREEQLEELQLGVLQIQNILQHYEGSVYQFLMDDKGLVLIGVFGLPPRAHEDDALRGVHAAVQIERSLKELGFRAAIGVATGSAFCGIYGSESRKQYTALGNAMNIAARLMQASGGGVLCDVSTAAQVQKRRDFSFQQLDPLQVKGSSAPLMVFRPVTAAEHAVMTDSSARATQPLQTGMVGRAQERQAIAGAAQQLQEQRASSLIVLEGEAGIGKSRLIGELLENAQQRGLTCLIGTGQAIEKSIPYHAWRSIFATVFGLSNATESLKRRRERVLSQLTSDVAELSSLLNVVLPLEFPETGASAELQGEARAETTRHLLLRVLKSYLGDEPVVLVLDDAHWFDSASWGLTRAAAQQLSPAAVVIATRATLEAPISDYEDLLKVPGVQRFQLNPLTAEDVLRLVCQRLGVKTMLEPISDYVLRKTEGNPLFIEELVYALRDAGAIEIRGAECRLGPQLAGSSKSIDELFRGLHLPATMQGIITSRVDRFAPSPQMVLKVASVIGRSFSIATLRDIYPIESDKTRLTEMVEELEASEMLRPAAGGEFEFRHPLIQEVVYEAIPVASRRELHRATAEWFEHSHAENLQSYAPLLAHHWSKAGVSAKVIEYSAIAGNQALRQFSILEAVAFLTQAIDLERARSGEPGTNKASDPRSIADWELQLGSAYVSWSKYDEAREHLERGLALMGKSVPSSAVRGTLALLGQIARQIGLRWRNKTEEPVSQDQRASLLATTRAYEGLMEIYYITDKPVPCLYSVFRGLNIAEKAGPSPELARCYSSTAALLGFMGMRKYADGYFERAAAAAQKAADPSAQAWVLMTKGVYLAGLGKRDMTRENLLQSIEIYDRLGDSRRGDDARANLAASSYLHSQFKGSLALADRIYATSLVRRDPRNQAEAMRWRAYNLLALGRFPEVPAAIEELDGLRSSTVKLGGFHRKQDVATLTALLRVSRGDHKGGLEAAMEALNLMGSLSDSFEFLLERAGIALVCLEVAESDHPLNATAADGATRAVKALGKYAKVYPIGRPAHLFCRGRWLWLQGKHAEAQESWKQCLHESDALATPIYAALAHREIAKRLPSADAARVEHERQAEAILQQAGAATNGESTPQAARKR